MSGEKLGWAQGAAAPGAAQSEAPLMIEGASAPGAAPRAVEDPAAPGAAQGATAPGAVERAELGHGAAEKPQGHGLPGDAPLARGLALPPAPAEFSVTELGWLSLAYHPSLGREARLLREKADGVKAELTALLGRPVLDRVHVRLGRTPEEMAQLTPQGGSFPRYASGLAYSDLGLVLLTAAPRYPGERFQLEEIFRHELAHVALHDAAGGDRVPRWFNEGFAVYASKEAVGARLQTLWTATLAGTLLPLQDLTRRFPEDSSDASIAYAEAADIVRFLLKDDRGHRFAALVERIASGQEFDRALGDAYSTDTLTLESEWREDVAKRYTFWPFLLGGSTIWMVALGLVVWGYVRRKRRADVKLERWAREEAAEDAALARRQAEAERVIVWRPWSEEFSRGPSSGASPARSVTESWPAPPSQAAPDSEAPSSAAPSEAPAPRSGSVPRIEHDGGWHTLH